MRWRGEMAEYLAKTKRGEAAIRSLL
jgi:hypothetical protein